MPIKKYSSAGSLGVNWGPGTQDASGSNFTRLPDGTLIQFGVGDIPDSGTNTATIVFPKAFASKPLVYVSNDSSWYDTVFTTHPTNTTATSTVVTSSSDTGTAIYTRVFTWLAIGK